MLVLSYYVIKVTNAVRIKNDFNHPLKKDKLQIFRVLNLYLEKGETNANSFKLYMLHMVE